MVPFNIIPKDFGKATDDIEAVFRQMQDIVASMQETNTELLSLRSNLRKAGIKKTEARRLTKQFSLSNPDPENNTTKLEASVGKGRAKHVYHYLSSCILKPGYTFKRSDVMDLMQICYAYDCDLFRCDKAMANNFRDFEPFKGKLVGRFAELPERIDSKLTETR